MKLAIRQEVYVMVSKIFNPWEVWYAQFPYEEDSTRHSGRPVIVLQAKASTVLVVKVTCHTMRRADCFDTPLRFWKDAHLDRPSVARVSKAIELPHANLLTRIGVLKNYDAFAVFESYTSYLSCVIKTQLGSKEHS